MMSTTLPSMEVGWMQAWGALGSPNIGIVRVCEEYGFYVSFIVQCRSHYAWKHLMTRFYRTQPLALFLVANNRIIESKHPYSYSRIWQNSYSDPPHIRFVYS